MKTTVDSPLGESRRIRRWVDGLADADEFEPGPAVVAFGDGDRPAVGLDHRADDREPESGPLAGRAIAVFEDRLAFVLGNPGPVVLNEQSVGERADADGQLTVAMFHAVVGLCPTACGTMFHTVPKEVLEDVQQELPVGED